MSDFPLVLIFVCWASLCFYVATQPGRKYRRWKVRSDAAHAAYRAWWAERERVVGAWHASAAEPLDRARYDKATEAARDWLATHPEPSVWIEP